MTSLAGKTAVVTGGAGDIGLSIVSQLLASGAAVHAIDRKPAAEALSFLKNGGCDRAAYHEVDVRDRRAMDETLAAIGTIDIAIGNAGVVEAAPFLEITEEQWQRQVEINLTGCFNLGQGAARVMVRNRTRGRIVFTSSWVQDVPWPEIAAYSATKAAIRMLARSMARELASDGILVNVIAPGIVNAGLAKHQLETEPQYARRVSKVIPLGRLQSASEVAQAIMFLCSDAAGYMTGSVLLADGGCSLFAFEEDAT